MKNNFCKNLYISLRNFLFEKDLVFARLLKNSSLLLFGNIIAAILGLLVTAIRTRSLGSKNFGLLVLIITYVEIIGQFATFQSWQGLIKFGTEAIKLNHKEEFMGYVKLSFIIDGLCGFIGTAVAISVAYLFPKIFGLDHNTWFLAGVYCFSLLFDFSGMSLGVLRTLDYFKLITIHKIISAAFKCFLMGFVFFYNGDIWSFIEFSLIGAVVDKLLLFLFALFVLLKEGYIQYTNTKITNIKNFFKFSGWIYLSTTIDLPVQQFDVIIASFLVSLEAAGVYKVIKQVVQLLAMIADPIYQAIYPQFVSMISNGDKENAIRYARKIGILIFALFFIPGSLFSISSFYWFEPIFGKGFASGWMPLTILFIFKIVSISFIPIHPLFNALGYVRQSTKIIALANISYFFIAIFLTQIWGVMGLILAYGIQFLSVAGSKTLYLKRRNNFQHIVI